MKQGKCHGDFVVRNMYIRQNTKGKALKLDSPYDFFLEADFFDLEDGLELSLNADGQNSVTLHTPQRGLKGVQTVWPNPTYLFSIQRKQNELIPTSLSLIQKKQ